MFEYISTRIQSKYVSVQLEGFNQNKFRTLFPSRTQNVPFQSDINLFKLTYQMHLSKPMSDISRSSRTKFSDYVAYTRRITNVPHLDFNVSDMDGEQKKQASEIIAEGLSRCLTINLFNVQENTLVKNNVKGRGKRADFKGTSNTQEIIVCESKGSFDSVSQSRIDRALTQKATVSGNINIAAINNIGHITRIIDPPGDDFEQDRFDHLVDKTNHYIQIFKLAGQRELTRYFELMKLRFKNHNLTNFPEFSEKTDLWFKLKYERQRKVVNHISFIGKVELIDNNKILFIGFDERLLSIDTFENFLDYQADFITKEEDITTFLSRDGVCFIEAPRANLVHLFPDLILSDLKYYQEFTWLTDIDNMNEFEFANYLKYAFEQSDIKYVKEQRIEDRFADFVIDYKDNKFYLELKLYGREQQLVYSNKIKNLLEDRFKIYEIDTKPKKEIQFLPKIDFNKQILVTNIDKRLISLPKKAIVFDRNDLKILIKNPAYFKEFLSKISK